MARERVEQFLELMDDAFEGPDWHSLLSNLASVTPDDWEWVPPGGERTIRRLVRHVVVCKYLYENQAFGDGQKAWEALVEEANPALGSIETAIPCLRAAHEKLRGSVAALDDDRELLRLRPHHMGTPRETRWIIMIMMQHDLYHAGEINHIRALHQQND